MKLAGKTDVGRVRRENQDDFRAGELPGGEDYLTAYFHRDTGILDHVRIQPMEN